VVVGGFFWFDVWGGGLLALFPLSPFLLAFFFFFFLGFCLGYVSVTVGGLLLNLVSQSRSWIPVLAMSQ